MTNSKTFSNSSYINYTSIHASTVTQYFILTCTASDNNSSIDDDDDDDDDDDEMFFNGWPTKSVKPYFQPRPLS